MAECYRRIIHRPAGVDDSSWSRLGELLSDAVDRQQELASHTKHVLRFEGGLQPLDDATGYFVEHEPATSLSIGGLFDPSAPALHEVQLVRVTAALYEALGAAQTAEGSGPKAHGTVCPGVILFAPDGTAKVTDFSLGPAVCTALGEEAYLNLAVNPVATGSPGTYVTGSWEILAREEFTRDGRLCAFIDPQKYGAQTLSAFEPVSDVIAAAFVLHLLAEHQHPYLHDDPTAHRLVEMSEFMAMGRYNGARREDLRESTNPGMRIWCDLMAKALSRIPQNRPSPKQVVDALADHLRPEEDSDLLRHQLESVETLVGDQPWDQVRQAARGLAENSAAPADVIQRANAIVVQAQANLLIEEAQRALACADWPDAKTPIDAALNMSGLPVDLAAEVRRMNGLVESSLAMRVTLDEIQERLQQVEGTEPYETVELLQRQLARLEDTGGDRALVSPIEKRVSALRRDLSDRLKEALPAAQAAMEADRARAEEWIEQLQSTLEDQAWDAVERLLEDRPQVRNWPEDVLAQSHAVRRQLDQHRTEQERLHAIKTDEAAAQLWVDQLRLAVDAHQWERAQQLLGSKPNLAHWPEDLEAQADRLVPRIRAAYEKHEAQKGAREWCERLQQAVQTDDRSAAVTLLSERPELEEWPLGALDEIAPYQRQAEQWVEDAKKEQEQLTQQNRLIQAWLDRANQASKDERWDEAVGILDAPPLEHLPQDAQEQADKLRAFCLARTSAEAAQEFQARCEAVETVARNFVRSIVSQRFDGLIHTDAISVGVHTEAAGSNVADAEWSAEVDVGAGDDRANKAETTFAFTFQVSLEPAQVRD
ncbi:MAG: hypothetical protein IID43_02480, partial [Planctomycetes bacterium]|nr:hypothetical protein [Planctomycetota bacterium]